MVQGGWDDFNCRYCKDVGCIYCKKEKASVAEVEFNEVDCIEVNKHGDKFSIHLYDNWEAFAVTDIDKEKIIELIEKLQDLIR